MHTNYTASDLLLSAQAFALMPLFFFIPGFVLGWLLRVLDFRRRSFSEQVLLSTPLSLAVCPIATYLVWLSTSVGVVWFFYGGCWAIFPVVLAFQARRFRWSELRVSRYTWIALGILAVWCLVILFSLVDLQIQDRLYSSVPRTTTDFVSRSRRRWRKKAHRESIHSSIQAGKFRCVTTTSGCFFAVFR